MLTKSLTKEQKENEMHKWSPFSCGTWMRQSNGLNGLIRPEGKRSDPTLLHSCLLARKISDFDFLFSKDEAIYGAQN